MGLVHGNVTIADVQVSGTTEPVVKLTKVGVSNLLRNIDGRFNMKQGSRIFLPPEHCGPALIPYDASGDIWSCGILAYLIIFGQIPFDIVDSDTMTVVMQRIKKTAFGAILEQPAVVEKLSVGARDFLKKMLTADPKLRPTTAQLLEHEWLSISQKSETVLKDSSAALATLVKIGVRSFPYPYPVVHNTHAECPRSLLRTWKQRGGVIARGLQEH
jgi:serine/threonine protein kinase